MKILYIVAKNFVFNLFKTEVKRPSEDSCVVPEKTATSPSLSKVEKTENQEEYKATQKTIEVPEESYENNDSNQNNTRVSDNTAFKTTELSEEKKEEEEEEDEEEEIQGKGRIAVALYDYQAG